MKLSIVVPCYNEESNIPLFYREIIKLPEKFEEGTEFEFIFVNDGSGDETYSLLREYSEKDERVKYISFTRNFGKESAMLAGLKYSTGDYVVVMDADLQDPPELIPKMYELIKSGKYERIATKRSNRSGEPIIRSFFSEMFYRLINKISDVEIVNGARDFSMMSRRMVETVIGMNEKTRFSKGLFEYPGYKTKWLSYKNKNRKQGSSKWSFGKLFVYAIEGIVSFSNYPLVISSIIGILFCLFAFFMVLVIIIRKLIFDDPVQGWASTACIIIFSAGLQQLGLGIIGSYLSRIFTEIKNRPLYIVEDTNIA